MKTKKKRKNYYKKFETNTNVLNVFIKYLLAMFNEMFEKKKIKFFFFLLGVISLCVS